MSLRIPYSKSPTIIASLTGLVICFTSIPLVLTIRSFHDQVANLGNRRRTFWAAFQSSTEASLCLDPSGRIVAVNPAAEKFWGFARQTMRGFHLWDFCDENQPTGHHSQAVVRLHLNKVLMASPVSFKWTGYTLSGVQKRMDLKMTAHTFDTPPFVVLTCTEITTNAEEDRVRSLYLRILEASHDPAGIINSYGQLLDFNTPAAKLLRLPRDHGKPIVLADWIVDDRDSPFLPFGPHTFEGNRHTEFLAQVRASDGTVTNMSVSALGLHTDAGDCAIFYLKPVTKTQSPLARSLSALRMQQIGSLVGGIAHDLSNTLTPALVAADTLRQKADPHIRDLVDVMEDSATKAGHGLQQLYALARSGDTSVSDFDARRAVKELLRFMTSTFPKNIDVVASATDDACYVRGNLMRLQCVLLALAVNAKAAMGRGGTLTISLETFDVRSDVESIPLDLAAGQYAVFTIADTGCGIPPGKMAHLFDDPAWGVGGNPDGLNLPTALKIVRAWGGTITVESEVDRGSQFVVYLPTARKPAKTKFTNVPNLSSIAAGRSVLIVDDDEAIRSTLSAKLNSYGFFTIGAEDARSAMAVLNSLNKTVDVAIVDLLLPDIEEEDALLKKMHAVRPSLAVLVASGGVLEEERAKKLEQLSPLGVTGVVRKPYQWDTFTTELARALTVATASS